MKLPFTFCKCTPIILQQNFFVKIQENVIYSKKQMPITMERKGCGTMTDAIEKLKEIIDNTDNIVFFGGAGVSTESNT